MKKIIRIQIGVLFFLFQTLAHAQGEQGASAGCENNTNTNWNPQYTNPNNNTYQTNTFKWTDAQWSYYLNFGTGPVFNTINNPFNSTDAYLKDHIAKDLVHSDYRVEDGWELIKQDLGFYYGNNNYNGNGNGSFMWAGGGNTHDHATFGSSYDPMLYFILYNKYTGVLRVLANINSVNSPQDKIYIHLAFTGNNGDNINALFNHYNDPNTTRTLPLDKSTIVTDIGAVANFPAQNSNKFFYADFQLAYDPCICIFQSGLHVYFEHINTATINLTGRFAGTANPLSLANVSGGSGNSYGDGTNSAENFIASVFAKGNSPQAVMQSYDNLSDMQNEANGTNVKAGLFFLADVVGAVIAFSDENYAEGIKACMEAIVDGAEYFGLSTDSQAETPRNNVQPMLLSGYTSMSGNISTTVLDNGYDAYIAVPGSPETTDGQQPTEYAFNYNGDAIPAYPMYNETPGLFALLKTPEINQFESMTSINACLHSATVGTNPHGDPIEQCVEFGKKYTYTFAYNPSSDLVYALSPIVDASKSKIFVGYEIDGTPVANLSHTESDLTYMYDSDYGSNHKFRRYKTKFFPIGCNQQVFTKEVFQTAIANTLSGPAPTDDPEAIYPRNVTLVVLLGLVSKPDAYGKTHRSAQIIKYNCNINSVTTNFVASGNGQAALAALTSAPTNLQINTTTYTSLNPATVFSWGTISIIGNLYNPWTANNDQIIEAEKEIDVTGEVDISTLGSEIDLRIRSLPPFFDACSEREVPPLDYASVTSFCNNSDVYEGNQGYQSNQGGRVASFRDTTVNETEQKTLSASNTNVQASNQKVIKAGETKPKAPVNSIGEQTLGKNYKIGLYPNPTASNVTLGVITSNGGSIRVRVEDVTGKELINQNFKVDKGFNTNELNFGDFNNGIYVVKISNDKGDIIQTEKIILNR
jgi:hypothetical protein